MARELGNVRKLPSGRWQARYHGPDGQRRSAPYTFDTKTAAMRWLRLTESEGDTGCSSCSRAFCSLRWGEVSALRRCDVAEDGVWVRVSVAHTEVAGRGIVVGPPKSRAGIRTIVVPEAIRADLVTHLRKSVGREPSALVFTGDKGRAIRRTNFSQRVKWTATVRRIGVSGLHFHDLRHAGNAWAAQTKVSTRDLMARMGHDDMRAELIYQRATQEAAERIARGLSDLADRHRAQRKDNDDDPDDGPTGSLVPTG